MVWAALEELDFASLRLPRALMALRSLPSALLRGRAATQRRALRLREIEPLGFGVLAEEPGRELALGVHGSFWRPSGNVQRFDRAAFSLPIPEGTARAVWSFTVAPAPRGARLETETRIRCGDAASRRRFALYWLLVRPGSGLIRRSMLAAVRREAERRAARGGSSRGAAAAARP